jgi:hypothetical protein
MFAGDGKLLCFGGFFTVTHDSKDANLEDFNVRPKQLHNAMAEFAGHGPTVQVRSLNQWELLFFKTRDGSKGVLQIVGFTDEPDAVKIRYKLVSSSVDDREELAARLDAAGMIGSLTERDKALSGVATDAAKAGEVETVSDAIERITTLSYRDQAALDAVRLLAKRGFRKDAIQIAQRINSNMVRDLALSELAQ